MNTFKQSGLTIERLIAVGPAVLAIAILALLVGLVCRRKAVCLTLRRGHKALVISCGCAIIPVVFVGSYATVYGVLFLIGLYELEAAENAPKVAPPAKYVGVWEATEKTILLIAKDGVASYRHNSQQMDGGRVRVDLKDSNISVTLMGTVEKLHLDSPPTGPRMVLGGIEYRRTAEYSSGKFGEGDDPN